VLISLACWATSLVQSPRANASTVAVGDCLSRYVSYQTISAAVAAVSPGSTVRVCPGTYPEQVVITTPLTLSGAFPSGAVITAPLNLAGPQIFVQGDYFGSPLTVNISNIIVDGSGSNDGTGISYVDASGQLDRVEVRDEYSGITLVGDPFVVNTVNIRNSNIHDFISTGVIAKSGGATSFFVNITRSLIKSSGTSVQSGVEYIDADGVVSQNIILVSGGNGLLLDNFFSGMTAQGNTIEGANVGIMSGGNFNATGTTIENNILFNNATGISLGSDGVGGAVITSNAIVESSVAAINLNCSTTSAVQNNLIYGTPLGISNILPGDTITSNTFLIVGTETSECQE
jgi:hypothetical protein